MNTVKLEIYRYNPEQDEKPYMQSFEAPVEKPGMKLLDALNYIKWQIDGSLTYRRSCGEGVCGSDGLNINGVNGLGCITPVEGLKQPIQVRPLPSMQVVRDLVVDMEHFFDQYKQVKPWLQSSTPRPEHERLQSPEERAELDGSYECIQIGRASCRERVCLYV